MRRVVLLVMDFVLVEHLGQSLAIRHLLLILVVHTPPNGRLLY